MAQAPTPPVRRRRLAQQKGLDAPHTIDATVRENVRPQMKRTLEGIALLRDLVAKR